MTLWVKIENETVVNVMVASADVIHRYEGEWIETAEDNSIRKQYAGIGYKYDRVKDQFVEPRVYPSWVLDDDNNWQPPTPYPREDRTETPVNNDFWRWIESKLEWVEFKNGDEEE